MLKKKRAIFFFLFFPEFNGSLVSIEDNYFLTLFNVEVPEEVQL